MYSIQGIPSTLVFGGQDLKAPDHVLDLMTADRRNSRVKGPRPSRSIGLESLSARGERRVEGTTCDDRIEAIARAAEADRLDSGWSLRELEARREALPDEANGVLQVATLLDDWSQF